MTSIAQQRQDAEERSWALLRSIVPSEELKGGDGLVGRDPITGRFYRHAERIEFLGQSKKYSYVIYLNGTVSNIRQINPNPRHYERHTRTICGGPYLHNDYLDTTSRADRWSVRVNMTAYHEAQEQALAERQIPLSLPSGDFFLGQYLALKFDEADFLEHAVIN